MATSQTTTDTLSTSITRQAGALRAADTRLQDQRAAMDALILQGMESGLTWATLQHLTGLTPATLNASRRRAVARRQDQPGTDDQGARSS